MLRNIINIFQKIYERVKVIIANSALKKVEDSIGKMVSLYGEKYWTPTQYSVQKWAPQDSRAKCKNIKL